MFCLAIWACEGPEGPTGPAGSAGADGTDGAAGATGSDGAAGQTGATGAAGTPGRNALLTEDDLAMTLRTATIAPDGTATVDFELTDGAGRPLDVNGTFSEGEITTSFILAWLDQDDMNRPLYYTAYTTRDQTSSITNVTETQASTDSGGTLTELSEGVYRYTFGTPITVADASKTHTVAAYARRTLDDGTRKVANAELDFRPDGQAVTVSREVVSDDACNACHQDLAIHGGQRKDIKLCITCHSPQSVDPDTGNTVDMKVMIHKIHMGVNLPSNVAGTPYQIIGYRNSVHDYSNLHYPQEMNRCDTCHEGAQANLAYERPDRESCVACHDDIVFEEPVPTGKTLHSGGTQPADAPCNVCHPASGSLAGITEMHATGLLDPTGPEVSVDLQSISMTAPGQTPTVRFQVMVDGAPRDISTNPLTTFRLTFAGPNPDFASYWQATVGSSGTLTAVDAANGIFDFTVPPSAAIPADASGSYTVGVEAYIQPTGMPRFATNGDTLAFSVTDATAVPRPMAVSNMRCNSCHADLGAHGAQRKDPNYCVTCHNPNNVGDERFARLEGSRVVLPSVDMKVMIHKIHAGAELEQGYLVGGYPPASTSNPTGNPVDFGEIHYPGQLNLCEGCHESGTYGLPTTIASLPVLLQERTCTEPTGLDADSYCTSPYWTITSTVYVQPAAAACGSCHDSLDAEAHYFVNTTPLGAESCGTCHGTGSEWDVVEVHAAD